MSKIDIITKANELQERSIKMKKEFDSLKKEWLNFFSKLYDKLPNEMVTDEYYKKFPGKRTPKIIKKLNGWPGDISPAMLVKLGEEFEANHNYYVRNQKEK